MKRTLWEVGFLLLAFCAGRFSIPRPLANWNGAEHSAEFEIWHEQNWRAVQAGWHLSGAKYCVGLRKANKAGQPELPWKVWECRYDPVEAENAAMQAWNGAKQ